MQSNTIERIRAILNSGSITDTNTDCWMYQAGSKDKTGHCKIRLQGKWRSIHRLSAHMHWGFDLDSDKLILHKTGCPNPNCWNPAHLYEGDQKDNVRDAITVGTHSSTQEINSLTFHNIKQVLKTHCPSGHLLDGWSEKQNQRYCKTCKRIRKQEHDAKRKMPSL